MTDVIKHNGILIGTGYFAEVSEHGSDVGIGSTGVLCMIERMTRTKRGENFIAVRSFKRMKTWPGVDGFIQPEYGIEYEINDFVRLFDILRTKAVINGYVVNKEEFKNVPSTLIGLILDRRNREFSALVEFDFCINNGGCADGLGKYGQCLCVPVKYINFYIGDTELNFDDMLTMSDKNRLRNIDRNIGDEKKMKTMKLKKMIATRDSRPEMPERHTPSLADIERLQFNNQR